MMLDQTRVGYLNLDLYLQQGWLAENFRPQIQKRVKQQILGIFYFLVLKTQRDHRGSTQTRKPLIKCLEPIESDDSGGVVVHLFPKTMREMYPRMEYISILG